MDRQKTITNLTTGQTIILPLPKDEEVTLFDESLLISETDVLGFITYTNRRYCNILGYSKKELIGTPQSIEHHPDMPIGLYDAIQKITSSKKIWRGYVKSLCKDGRYFWSLLYVQPKVNDENVIIGYTSTRKKAYEDAIPRADEAYKKLQGEEYIGDSYFMGGELYLGAQLAQRGKVLCPYPF